MKKKHTHWGVGGSHMSHTYMFIFFVFFKNVSGSFEVTLLHRNVHMRSHKHTHTYAYTHTHTSLRFTEADVSLDSCWTEEKLH